MSMGLFQSIFGKIAAKILASGFWTTLDGYDNETKHHIAYVEAETDDGCDWNESEE